MQNVALGTSLEFSVHTPFVHVLVLKTKLCNGVSVRILVHTHVSVHTCIRKYG